MKTIPTATQFAVLPFRVDEQIRVLLMRSPSPQGWSLPATPSASKRVTQYANAAATARRVGVSGRVYKAPLRATSEDHRISVFPFLVQGEAAADDDGVQARWFSLREAADLVDDDFLPVLNAFARRVGREAEG